MFLLEVVFALTAGIIFAVILSVLLRRTQSLSALLSFFTLIFLSAWAGGIWLRPYGPSFKSVHWLPFFVSGAIVSLIIAILVPPRSSRGKREVISLGKSERIAGSILSIFFWVLTVLLSIFILLGYTWLLR
jgi:hypothetical protein